MMGPSEERTRSAVLRIFSNLVHNAIEAGDSISVAVEDTGLGLSSEETNTIFEAFVTTKSQGMGLGLAICRMIVERHEGQL